jgi:predicted DNA-binding transcriptional regulator AlpA
MTVRLLDRRQLKAEKGLPNSKAHLHRVCRHPDPDQRFPQPVKVGNQSRWLESEVDDYIVRRAAERRPLTPVVRKLSRAPAKRRLDDPR